MYRWVLATKSSGDITLRWTTILSSRVAIFLGTSCYMYLNIIVIIIIISFVIKIITIYNYYYYFFKSLFPLVVTLCDLSDANTTVLICYEERTTGNKPLLEKKFHQVQIFSSCIEFSFHMMQRIMRIKEMPRGNEVDGWTGLLPIQPCFPSNILSINLVSNQIYHQVNGVLLTFSSLVSTG